jgi:hypothetical protein
MKKKIFYWGPFLDNKVVTVKAIKNSVFSINNYSKIFEGYIIDAVGEWSNLNIKDKKNLNFVSTKINKMILQSIKKTKKYLIYNNYKKIEKILKNEN